MISRVLCQNISKRTFATAVTYAANGNPLSVLKLGDCGAAPAPKEDEIKVRILASVINPSDLNMIEGTYGTSAKLPAVAGKECVAVVEELGAKVKNFQVGDHVIPGTVTFGAWRTEGTAPAADFLGVSKQLPIPYAASLHVNPCTAYRMLRDFKDLKPGDVVMQNAPNSMVGLAVVQMAREMGLRTINIVRSDRPQADDTLRLLDSLGGTVNVLDTWVNTPHFAEMCAELPPISLALNGVGGESAAEMVRALAPGGTMVTYGGMSRKPMTVPMDVVVQKQLNLAGFWISKWHEEHSQAERHAMLSEITDLILNDKLSFFYEQHDFDDFEHALRTSMEPFRLRKTVLNMDYPDRFAEHDALPESAYDRFLAPNDA